VHPVPANAAAPTVEEHTRIAAWDSANERSIGFLSGAMEEAIARRVEDAAEMAAGIKVQGLKGATCTSCTNGSSACTKDLVEGVLTCDD